MPDNMYSNLSTFLYFFPCLSFDHTLTNMSQSDYIKYKRVSQELKQQAELPPILSGQNYVDYKQFSLENSIINHVPRYDKYIPQSIPVVFGMEKPKYASCSTFLVCSNTNTRLNRELNPTPLINMPLLQTNELATKQKKAGILPMVITYCKCVTP